MIETETQSFLRSAEILRNALTAVLALLILMGAVVVVWTLVETGAAGRWLAAQVGQDGDDASGMQAFGLTALTLTQIGIWYAVVWQTRRIFTALLIADASAAGAAARRTAQLLWVVVIWGVLAAALGTVVASWHYPEGERTLAVSIGPGQITTIFAALLASFTSHAFVLGAALWRDHREVI
ncbi:hypothetical protein [uncultured Sulfitobacter sp.]|uniref:hypothetical protein n=1 Tax=uncultured Sulfitobacter sp. TaxID=191468 RepID=UPI0026040BC3|nr:hypothetical protein [uncultured Sulfitobacter sp.]